MCLLALAIGASARWPLVIASNRDEFHDRPTLPLRVWRTPAGATLMSGRDLRAGGTWLGCTQGGRIALLTNVRERAAAAGASSRGDLPLRWLSGEETAAAFLAQTDPHAYGGCNLVLGDFRRGEWTWASNRAQPGSAPGPQGIVKLASWQTQALSPGVYGVSNALLDTPWPKTQALKAAMASALAAADACGEASALESLLWPALASRERAPWDYLPQTGIDPALEHALSSAHVDLPERAYGTRCSTLIWVGGQTESGGFKATVCEKSFVRTHEGSAPTPGDAVVRLDWEISA
jgi:uncharacterized protein with NRDE domain